MRLTIYWTKKGRACRREICGRFGIEYYMTVNGETRADIRDGDMELLRETARRGFIEIRNK